MVDFLNFVEKWFVTFIELFQTWYHTFKDDLGLIPEVEEEDE